MAPPSLTDAELVELRRILEDVSELRNERGVPFGVSSRAGHFLTKLVTVRARALPARNPSRPPRGESVTARKRRVREEALVRDGRCAVPGFLGARCNGAKVLDHFFGRAKVPESSDVCWILCGAHDYWKTQWRPTRLAWLERFAEHAREHGYGEALQRAERGIALEEGQHPKHADAGATR